jgi:hypothetical protein
MVPPDREVRNMKRDAVSGLLLIVGAVTGVLVMAIHPTAHDLLEPGHFGHQARLNALVHGLAVVSIPVLFLGLLGLARKLGPSDLTSAALVAYAFGGMAILCAAVADGFVATEVIGRMLDAEGASRDTYHTLLSYTSIWNQAFAKVYVVAMAASLLLWAFAIEKSRRIGRAAGIAGLVIGGALLLAFFAGQLRLNVHGFGIVILLQAVWLIWVGVLLIRSRD